MPISLFRFLKYCQRVWYCLLLGSLLPRWHEWPPGTQFCDMGQCATLVRDAGATPPRQQPLCSCVLTEGLPGVSKVGGSQNLRYFGGKEHRLPRCLEYYLTALRELLFSGIAYFKREKIRRQALQSLWWTETSSTVEWPWNGEAKLGGTQDRCQLLSRRLAHWIS